MPDLQTVLERRARKHVGVAVAVVRGGETSAYACGRLARDRPAAVAADTIFEIGSITKVLTATLLGLLAEEGVVALDDPVNRHLPPDVQLPVRGRRLTLLDLATHRSGLPRLPPGLLRRSLWRHRHDPYAPLTPELFDQAIRGVRLRREPGRKLRYSNFGAGLLGHVLARAAGASYEELVRARICLPLGMHDTWVDLPAAAAARFADGHGRRGRAVAHWQLPTLAGAGALRSSAADMARFLAAQRRPPEGPLGAAIRLTQQPLARRGPVEQCPGWMRVSRRGRTPMHCHDGGTGGFRSFAGFTPEHAVVVLANSARPVHRIAFALFDALDGRR